MEAKIVPSAEETQFLAQIGRGAVTGLLAPFVIAGYILLLLPATLVRAWVAGWLWLWFVTPVFHLAPPGVALVLGLMIAARFVMTAATAAEKSDRSTLRHAYTYGVVHSCFALALAWGVHLWTV